MDINIIPHDYYGHKYYSMDLYDDIPEVSDHVEPLHSLPPVVLVSIVKENSMEEEKEKVEACVIKEVEKKEEKPSHGPPVALPVDSSIPSLHFVPPSLRMKTSSPQKKVSTPKAPLTAPKTTSTFSIITKEKSIPITGAPSYRLEEVEDEYLPDTPNEFATFQKLVKEQKQREKRIKEEEKRMIGSLHSISTHSEPKKVENGSDDFGTRIMRKYGWKTGEGIGKDGQGISIPLMAKKSDGHSGIIVNPDHTYQHTLSSIILLENMVEEHEEGLEGEVGGECEKFGKVVHVVCATGFDSKIRIFVEFETHKEAKSAHEKLNGRFFAGRQVSSRFYPKDAFRRREYTR